MIFLACYKSIIPSELLKSQNICLRVFLMLSEKMTEEEFYYRFIYQVIGYQSQAILFDINKNELYKFLDKRISNFEYKNNILFVRDKESKQFIDSKHSNLLKVSIKMQQKQTNQQSNHQSKDHQQQQEEYCLCENPLIRSENNTCEECTHSISSKLTEQINELQNKLRFYERKNEQIQRMVQQYQQTYELNCITSVKESLEKEIMTEKEAQKQIVYLKNRLSQIQANLQEQIQISKELDCQQTQLQQQLISLQSQQLKLSQQLLMLQGSCHSVSMTQSKLKHLLQVLSRTNFINVMFSISFEDDNSFLNGQKITYDNCWKIVEIIAFYHQIYAQNYKPVVDIMLQTMQVYFIDPQQSQVCSLNKSNSQIKTNSIAKIENSINFSKDPIDILCISQEQIYFNWFPLIIYQTKNLFQFLAQQSGIGPQYRLKYAILPSGQFETIIKAEKQKKIDLNKKLNLSIKYLLSIIEQINKLEFFAKQKRIQCQLNRKLSQND